MRNQVIILPMTGMRRMISVTMTDAAYMVSTMSGIKGMIDGDAAGSSVNVRSMTNR